MEPTPMITDDIFRAIPSGKAVLQATIEKRLGGNRPDLQTVLLSLKAQGLLNYYYGPRGRVWFRGMARWQHEFPRFPRDAIPGMPRGFVDVSWHNDTCPSFARGDIHEDENALTIWVDYPDRSEREYQHGNRYALVRGIYGAEARTVLCTSDDWGDILAAIARA